MENKKAAVGCLLMLFVCCRCCCVYALEGEKGLSWFSSFISLFLYELFYNATGTLRRACHAMPYTHMYIFILIPRIVQ
ncbi:MAG: hypothetical protein J3R72DRAFT_450192 [Linnemannia gamsii]|nr:MAG: hypothetical protein J3R72DRAFT_450192 [Linnemannia gamsii]